MPESLVTVDSDQSGSSSSARWLLLIHHVPAKPDYLRVKVRRRLTRLGALPLKNSVYVLPDSDSAREDFQWLLREIVSEGGEAALCASDLVDGVTDAELRTLFQRDRDADYAAIIATVSQAGQADGALSPAQRATLERRLRKRSPSTSSTPRNVPKRSTRSHRSHPRVGRRTNRLSPLESGR